MQEPVKERIAKMREEIAQITEANRLYLKGGKKMPGSASDQVTARGGHKRLMIIKSGA